jgi:hypothetical protein
MNNKGGVIKGGVIKNFGDGGTRELVEGSLVCCECGQTKRMRLPKGVTPDLDQKWHNCDPARVNDPSRQVSNEVFRVLSLMAGKPLRIGGISAEDSAFNDIVRRSTKKP